MFAFSIDMWVMLGFIGQIMFFMRFFIQWIYSERRKESVIPIHFWYFSIIGGIILLVYAIARKDLVFTTGQAVGLLVYVRNLVLIRNKKKEICVN